MAIIDGYVETDKDGTYRDLNSKALISTNKSEYQLYKENLAKQKNEISEKQNMKEEINTLKNDVTEIKGLLLKLLENKE